MFGIGFAELVLVMVVALLVVGPDKLPGLARSVAKGYNQLKRAGNDIKRSVTDLDLVNTLTTPDDSERRAAPDASAGDAGRASSGKDGGPKGAGDGPG
jgi:sec-independent protein translocase protein TatB